MVDCVSGKYFGGNRRRNSHCFERICDIFLDKFLEEVASKDMSLGV